MLLVVVTVVIELPKYICYQKCNSNLINGKKINSSCIVIKRETLKQSHLLLYKSHSVSAAASYSHLVMSLYTFYVIKMEI